MLRVVLSMAVLALVVPGGAAGQRVLTAEQWRGDLRALAAELPKQHRSAFDPVKSRATRAAFDSAVAELDRRIPTLADHQVVVELARIAAMLGDGHTRLTLPQDTGIAFAREHTGTAAPNDSALFFRHLPIRLDHFQEGLFVRAAAPEHRELIGAHVLEIGALPADSALKAVRPIVHHDNVMGFRFLAPAYLVVPEVLHAAGITPGPEITRLRLRDRGGRERVVELAPVPLFRAPRLVEARELSPDPVPPSARNLERWYWMERLPGTRTLYVQVNRVGSRGEESMQAFAARVVATARDSAVDRVVLDLRYNPGGNNDIGRPLVAALAGSEINRPGRLFVLVGRETFSAAQVLVGELERYTHALFVGEPTGSAPAHFGDSRRFRLPNSGLTVRASTVYHSAGGERREAIHPHIPVARRAEDYFANRDAALAAALAFQATDDAALLVRRVRATAGPESTMRFCWGFVGDPRETRARAEAAAAECGLLFLAEGRTELAVNWFRATLDHLPRSAASYHGLGRAYLAAGDRAKAREALREAVRIDPRNDAAKRLLDELGAD